MTMQAIETEYWAHHYVENPAQEHVEDDDWDEEALMAEIAARAEANAASPASVATPGAPEQFEDPGDWEAIE